jgi:hypothetical protein
MNSSSLLLMSLGHCPAVVLSRTADYSQFLLKTLLKRLPRPRYLQPNCRIFSGLHHRSAVVMQALQAELPAVDGNRRLYLPEYGIAVQ